MVYLVVAIFWGLSSVALAEKENWNERYRNLCEYDSACNLLKFKNQWSTPKKEVVILLKELSPAINKAARDFGIDPRAIAGSILTENSLNVSVSDDIQDWLVKMKIASDGTLLGKQFSFGLGQVNVPAAMEAESLMAKIESREMRRPEEVAKELLDPEQSIRYVAAIIRVAQDNYEQEGFDIRNKPEILATLYNLGKTKKRATQTKNSGKQPKVNYFGFFVEKNMETINGIIKPEISKKVLANREFWDFDKGIRRKRYSRRSKNYSRPKEMARRATNEIILAHAPPLCNYSDNDDDEDGEYIKSMTFGQSKPSGTIQFKEGFRVLSDHFDCDLNEWKLIESEDGKKQGWVSLDKIKEKSRPSGILKLCDTMPEEGAKKCIDEIKNIPNLELISKNGGSLTLRLLGKKGKVNWKNPNAIEECLEKEYRARKPPKALNREELAKLRDGIIKFKEKVCKVVDDCSESPYGPVLKELDLDYIEERCFESSHESNAVTACSGNVERFIKGIDDLVIKVNPAWSDLKEVLKRVGSMEKIQVFEYLKDDKVEGKEKDVKSIRESINYCLNIAKKYPKSTKLLESRLDILENPIYRERYIQKRYFFDSLREMCDLVKPLYIEKKQHDSQDDDCTHCSNSISAKIMPFPGVTESPSEHYLSMNILRSMLKDDEEKDLFLADQIAAKLFDLSYAVSKKQREEKCSYDPKLTAKLINSIFKLKCVRHIYVPDPWLINHFDRTKRDRMPYLKAFLENDRFEVNIQERSICTK